MVAPTTRAGLPLAAMVAVLLGGCGSAPLIVNSTELRLRVDEYRITPQLVQVHAGRLKIVAYDSGVLTHNVRVEETYNSSQGSPIVLGGTPAARPGQVVSGKLSLQPGTYKLIDTIANHADLGAYATLIVK